MIEFLLIILVLAVGVWLTLYLKEMKTASTYEQFVRDSSSSANSGHSSSTDNSASSNADVSDDMYQLNYLAVKSGLPEQAQEFVNMVIDKILDLNEFKGLFSSRTLHTFNKVCFDEFPELVEKYCSLDQASKQEKLPSFIDSCGLIVGFLSNLSDSVNDDTISDFEVTEKVLDIRL